jgi:hypothetical protein
MQKFILAILLTLPIASRSQIKVVIESSLARSTFSGGVTQISPNQTNTKPLWTISGRAVIEKRMSSSLFLSGGIAVDTKASHLMINNGKPDFSERDIYINYLSIPVGLFTKLPIGSQQLLIGGNLFLALPIRGYESGTQMSSLSGTSLLIFNRLKFGTADPTLFHPTVISGFDYGAEVYAQLQCRKFRFGVRYARGFKGLLVNSALYDRQYYHMNVALTVGYQF